MPFPSDVIGLLRFARGLRPLVREPLSADAAASIIRQGMKQRDSAFLRMVERAVFGQPTSPYLKLLRTAGCELGDVRSLVTQDGVEGALRRLHQAGVYVTFDEFKGRMPAVRGSQAFVFRDRDFDSPLVATNFWSSSGGTRGRPTRVRIDTEHIAQSAPAWALWFAAHGWRGNPLVFWTSTHSGTASSLLRFARCGARTVKWFATAGMATPKDRLIAAAVHHLVRRAGGFPRPEPVPLAEAWRVADYLAGVVGGGEEPLVNTSVSAAVRISLAALERGTSLRHVSFLLRGEPLTPARQETIARAGATAVQTYGFSEGGPVGSQCPTPAAADDVHVFLDAFAIIPHTRGAGDTSKAETLLFTGLRPAAPKVLLNADIGDHAVMETRPCGCLFDQVGFVQHLHSVRSHAKLTAEGVTFAAADIAFLVESVLPGRFGGTLADYQFVEAQEASGITRYTLLVDPRVGALDEAALRAAFLDALGRMSGAYRLMADLWARADILRIARQTPVATARGKTPPFHVFGPR